MASTIGVLGCKAPLLQDRVCISRTIECLSVRENRVCFAKRFCAPTPLARISTRSVHRDQLHPLQINAMGENAEKKTEEKTETEAKTAEYSASMQQAMGTTLEYRHELGMNYAHVLTDLIVGSCLQTPADADKLKDAGVGVIFCLQQDPDLAYFGVDLPAIQAHVKELDGIDHYRCQIRDFDPYDLRMRLPVAVAQLHNAIEAHKGKTAYVHCTAGLGRAPGVAKVRRCHPKLESIKAATADLLTEGSKQVVDLKWEGGPKHVEIAGLDVGWGQTRLPMEYRQSENQWILRRELPVGRYEYKFVVDGVWMTNPELPLSQPNREGQVNNVIEVTDTAQSGASKQLREQLMQEDADLTSEHRAKIRAKLEEIANSGQW
uniref:AMP-activated protein kinase glycogen-binding domain-containing protein n=1 Tax=Physcomitrium patens TaxID=3218 RepID=A0A7I4DZ91_PHYPA